MADHLDTYKLANRITKINLSVLGCLFLIFSITTFMISRVLVLSGAFYKSPFIVYVIGGLLSVILCWILGYYYRQIRFEVSIFLVLFVATGCIALIIFLVDRFNVRSWAPSVPEIIEEQVLIDFFEEAKQLNYEFSANFRAQGDISFTIFGNNQKVIYQPPYSRVSFLETIPENACIKFSLALAPEVWHIGMGDGVIFQITVRDPVETKPDQIVYSRLIDPKNNIDHRTWIDGQVDLNKWQGQLTLISFITTPGPANNDYYDWAGWGEPRMITCQSTGQ